MRKQFIIPFLSFCLLVIACSKPGPGGANNLNVYVMRDSLGNLCTNCNVFIKYGASEFSGEDTSNYDDSGVTDHQGKYTFTSLNKGLYSFYAWGKDPIYKDTIHGHITFSVESNKNERDIIVFCDTVLVNNN